MRAYVPISIALAPGRAHLLKGCSDPNFQRQLTQLLTGLLPLNRQEHRQAARQLTMLFPCALIEDDERRAPGVYVPNEHVAHADYAQTRRGHRPGAADRSCPSPGTCSSAGQERSA